MRFLRNSPFVQPFSFESKPNDPQEELNRRALIKFCYEIGMSFCPGTEWFLEELEDNDPIWPLLFESLNKQLYAVGITNKGKHVILQQAARSCVPTCVAMLALDHGKIPNYRAIEVTDLADDEQKKAWIKEAGLEPIESVIKSKEQFIQQVAQYGPGIMSLGHPDVGGHVIIVDAISKENDTVEIRDPLHGWALTMSLDTLLSWRSGNPFFQVKSR